VGHPVRSRARGERRDEARLDDRLQVARAGRVLDEPASERPFDVRAVLEADAKRRR
jgi:hypothetical protein